MKFGIAAKLGLLTTGVTLLMTVLVGWWSLDRARSVLAQQERGNLLDDADLQVQRFVNDFRYLRKDVRETANPPGGKGFNTDAAVTRLKKGTPDEAARALADLQKVFRELLERPENYYYLELCCLGFDAEQGYPALASISRPASGSKNLAPSHGELARHPLARPDLEKLMAGPQLEGSRTVYPARLSELQMFKVHSLPLPPDGSGKVTPMLLTIAFPVGSDNRTAPEAVLLLTIDFEEFIRTHTRRLPQHLAYLTSRSGRFLIHPDEARQREVRLASAGLSENWPVAQNDPALAGFRDELERDRLARADQQQRFRRRRGDEKSRLPIPEVAFLHGEQDLADNGPFVLKNWEALNTALDHLARANADWGLRFGPLTPTSTELSVSCRDAVTFDLARKAIAAEERKLGLAAPPNWRGPVRCKTFAVRFLLLNPDLDARDTQTLTEDDSKKTPRYFGLAMASALEVVEEDIDAAMGPMLVTVVGLASAAALVALIFSMWFTRPLKRIIAATRRIAEGDYQVELPVKSHDEIGVLARSFAHMIDQISVRREALEEALARMRSILDTAAEGIVTFDQHGIIEGFNQAAEKIFGYRPGEVKGKKISQLMELPDRPLDDAVGATNQPPAAPGQADSAASDSMRLVAAVLHTHGEVVGRRRDGSSFPAEVAFSAVAHEQRKIVTGIFRDITERKKAENEIRQMNEQLDNRVRLRTVELEQTMLKLEAALEGALSAGKARDAFMASMSHELRTPLNAILGYTEMLVENADDEGYSDIVPDLQKVHYAGKHLLDLINDILDWAKLGAGKMQLNLSDFDVGALLREMRNLAMPLSKQFGNELVFDIDAPLGTVHADEKRVRQVLLNLLSNACKFTEKGRVTLRARRRPGEDGDVLVFQVIDTGIGMSAEQMRKLFESFYQIDSSTTRKRGGTGLGLAISRSFCELMNGSIQVESMPGQGSTFTVTLPAVVTIRKDTPPLPVPASDNGQPSPTDDRPSGGRTVLVIDDDPAVRDLMERFLQVDGLEVRTASSAEEGLRLAKQLRPVAITLDVMMPGLDGWTMLALLKSDPVTADVPVIMVTIEDDRKRGFALGASDYLTKPIDWSRLGSVLRRHSRTAESGPVLVVEDDPVSRELVRRMLEREGHAVIEAENGRVALEKLAEGPKPALILLDLMMPEMDGFTFLDELRKLDEYEDVPVVVVTAKELTAEDRRRLNGGVSQILGKTAFSQDDLFDHIRQQVRQHTVTAGT